MERLDRGLLLEEVGAELVIGAIAETGGSFEELWVAGDRLFLLHASNATFLSPDHHGLFLTEVGAGTRPADANG